MRRRAFTLIEIIIAILIMSIMAASITLSTNAARHAAKREADRIVAQIYRLIETANRTQVSFTISFNGKEQSESISVEWETPETSQTHHRGNNTELKITKGFTIKSEHAYDLSYRLGDNSFNPSSQKLQVKGKDNDTHYIIIYTPGTRIRTSETSNDKYPDE